MVFELWTTLRDYLQAGGFVMPPLVLATLTLWFAIGYRWSILGSARTGDVREILSRAQRDEISQPKNVLEQAAKQGVEVARARHQNLRRALDAALAGIVQDVERFRVTIRAIVAVAPILGLLGTVTGMIETFDSLDDAAMFSSSGGIAAGISQALFTTQLGLSVAIPGLLLRGVLDRRQHTLESRLARLQEILCGDRRCA
jgi:biopolymer transport protein ExbB